MGNCSTDHGPSPALSLCYSFNLPEAMEFSHTTLKKRFSGIRILPRGQRGGMRGIRHPQNREPLSKYFESIECTNLLNF
jgi:hypothetical protein